MSRPEVMRGGSIGPRARVVATSMALLILCASVGCQTTGELAEKAESGARGILGKADPTGVLEMNRSIQEAAKSISERAEAIDTAELQACLIEARDALAALRGRIDALSPADVESLGVELVAAAGAVRAQLPRLGHAVDGVTALTVQLSRELERLDMEAAGRLLTQAEETLATMQTQLEPLAENVNTTLGAVRTQVDGLGAKLDALPLEDLAAATADLKVASASLRELAAGLPALGGEAHRLLGAARVLVWIVSGAVAIGALGALVRLLRPSRQRSAAESG